jgi:hypothetical protein
MLLGARLDKNVTNTQAMFLPDYLKKGFDSASVSNNTLVAGTQPVLQLDPPFTKTSLLQPLNVFIFLGLIILTFSFIKKKWSEKFLIVFDFLFFFIAGLAGILMLFMWFGTDHLVCKNNFNLMWAIPTHSIAAFFIGSNKKWFHYYLFVTIILQGLLLITWVFLPQELNIALVPVVLILLLRSWMLILNSANAKANSIQAI